MPASSPSPRLGLAAALFALMIPALAPAAEPLRWKFTKGETIHYSLVQKTETAMKAGPNEQTTTVDQISDLRWVVNEVDADGSAEMTQVIDRVQVKMKSSAQPPFEFDSKDDKPQEGPLAEKLSPLFKALAGFECSLKMDPRGRIESVKIPEKTLELLKASFPGQLSSMFSEDAMKNMITQSGLVLPELAVENGKGWTEQVKAVVPNLGTLVTDKNYTVVGPIADDAGKVKIALDAKMAVESVENPQVKFEIKEQKNQGDFAFDVAKGRIAKTHVEVKMVQVITVGQGALEQTMNNVMEMVLVPEAASK